MAKTWNKDEIEQLMEGRGYYLHSKSADDSSFNFAKHVEIQDQTIHLYVTVRWEATLEAYAQLSCANEFKMFLSLQSGWIQFDHPDWLKWEAVLVHYAYLAKTNPPF